MCVHAHRPVGVDVLNSCKVSAGVSKHSYIHSPYGLIICDIFLTFLTSSRGNVTVTPCIFTFSVNNHQNIERSWVCHVIGDKRTHDHPLEDGGGRGLLGPCAECMILLPHASPRCFSLPLLASRLVTVGSDLSCRAKVGIHCMFTRA